MPDLPTGRRQQKHGQWLDGWVPEPTQSLLDRATAPPTSEERRRKGVGGAWTLLLCSREARTVSFMPLRHFFLFSVAFAGISLSSPLQARPWVYVNGTSYDGSGEQCLKNAKEALAKAGFTDDLEIDKYKAGNSGGFVEGLLPDSPVRAVIECNGSEGVTAAAVSGLDGDLTYEKYSELYKAPW